ncbi:MAG: DUF58 domain-containing protein [Phycisphaerales bacterium]|nr:DUF58 domain-containing protein [Phycisphaerales bacterium]
MLPDDLIREVKRLEIYARRRVDDLFAGEYHAAFKGQGIEFAEVREYEPGDDVRSIDWNVTARAGRPFIKRFIEERRLTVLLCLDTSASHAFGTIGRSKARVAAEVASVLAMVASRNSDRVGLITFADTVKLFLPPRKGRTHLLRVIRECLDTSPKGGGEGLTEALELVRTVVRQHAIVFLLSDFLIDPSRGPGVLKALRMVSHRHEVVGVRISDPRELELPPIGLVKLVDPETRRAVLVDTASRSTRRRFAQAAEQRRQAIDLIFRGARSDLIDVSTARSFGPDLLRYFRARERRR